MEQNTQGQQEVKKESWKMKVAKIIVGAILAYAAYVIIVTIARTPQLLDKKKTDEQVAKIHATKLTLDDVMGKNLPADPGAEANKSIAGIDANHNGIRDDVELAIFKEYPNSAKTRAAALQYAMMLQIELTQVFNSTTLVAAMQEDGRAYGCLFDSVGGGRITTQHTDSLKKIILNTDARKNIFEEIYKKYMISYGDSAINGKPDCDIDPTSLPN